LVQIYNHFHRKIYFEILPNVIFKLKISSDTHLKACKKHSIISITKITAKVTRANTTNEKAILMQFINGPEVDDKAGNKIISMNTFAN
jgi:hypothetical protein